MNKSKKVGELKPQDLVVNNNDTMSSIEIAEVTGKSHYNVLRDIDKILEDGVAKLNFELGYYKDKNNQRRKMYNITKKGCYILASGYSPKLREAIINRLEELENEKKNGYNVKDIKDIIMSPDMIIAMATEIKKLRNDNVEKDRQLEQQQPHVEFAKAVSGAIGSILIRDYCKLLRNKYDIKIGEHKLYKWFKDNGYMYYDGKNNLPYQEYINKHLFECKDNLISANDNVNIIRITPIITPKGQEYFYQKLFPSKLDNSLF